MKLVVLTEDFDFKVEIIDGARGSKGLDASHVDVDVVGVCNDGEYDLLLDVQ